VDHATSAVSIAAGAAARGVEPVGSGLNVARSTQHIGSPKAADHVGDILANRLPPLRPYPKSHRQSGRRVSPYPTYTRSATFTDTYFAKPETVFTSDELLKVGIAASPLFPPGAQFDYSNTNTILLGMVIEKVTGKPVAEAFDAMVFKPLKLLNTSWPGQSTKIA
jgi:Beta-lactamase